MIETRPLDRTAAQHQHGGGIMRPRTLHGYPSHGPANACPWDRHCTAGVPRRWLGRPRDDGAQDAHHRACEGCAFVHVPSGL